MQFLRTLFPGGEIHLEEGGVEETPAAGSEPDQARTSSSPGGAPEAEQRVSDEGLFLSNLLNQIMPIIAPQVSTEPPEPNNASVHAMTQDSSNQVSMFYN